MTLIGFPMIEVWFPMTLTGVFRDSERSFVTLIGVPRDPDCGPHDSDWADVGRDSDYGLRLLLLALGSPMALDGVSRFSDRCLFCLWLLCSVTRDGVSRDSGWGFLLL